VIRTTETGADVHPKGQPCLRRSPRGDQSLDLMPQNLRVWSTNTATSLEEVEAEGKLQHVARGLMLTRKKPVAGSARGRSDGGRDFF
jgi:hypothetical protein